MSKSEVGDCGVLAIAFATSIANGVDPAPLQFNGRECREHLVQCLTEKNITVFPSTMRRSACRPPTKQTIPVYCYCRRIHYGKDRDMIECTQCLQWYHRMCVTLAGQLYPENPKKNKSWKCTHCE